MIAARQYQLIFACVAFWFLSFSFYLRNRAQLALSQAEARSCKLRVSHRVDRVPSTRAVACRVCISRIRSEIAHGHPRCLSGSTRYLLLDDSEWRHPWGRGGRMPVWGGKH